MIAHFYILAESFANNGDYSLEVIEEKVMRLAEDIKLIYANKLTNKLYTNYRDLYPQTFYSDYTVEDFICNPDKLKREGVNRDILNAMYKIIERSEETSISSSEVRDELLAWNDEENCHGLIAFHKVDNIDNYHQIVYGIDGWYSFRRIFLGKYPKNPTFFIDECAKYFPKIVVHERNKVAINGILNECPVKIVYHLAALNDEFRKAQQPGLNRSQVLEHFSINANLDAMASLEGNASRKIHLTFSFKNIKNEEEDVCCEPHLKLCRNDDYPGDTSYSNDRRIYFHEGKLDIENGKILIGHIGAHL